MKSAYYYSPSTKGFYLSNIHGDTIPQDALSIDSELYYELFRGQSMGYEIAPPDKEHDVPWLKMFTNITVDKVKANKLQQIITETEAAILAGFEYEIDGQVLHFSYQYNDQQNFADSHNVAVLGKIGVPGVPDSVTWNGWKVEKSEEGKEFSRSLVEVVLTADEFIALYTQGALAHKAKQMTIGTQRKAKVEEAASIEELEAI